MGCLTTRRRQHACVLTLVFSGLLLLAGCSDQSNQQSVDTSEPPPAPVKPPAAVQQPTESYPSYQAQQGSHSTDYSDADNAHDQFVIEIEASVETAAPQQANPIEEYRVVLAADETVRMPGIPGELRVWIGGQDYQPRFADDMVEDETAVPAVGESAKVQPFAPAFRIEPEETQCIRIHPSGSEVRFKLIPVEQGEFEVGADVFFFDSPDCKGSPIPKTAATLKVQVEVDPQKIVIGKALQLWDVLWEKFVEFWAALVAIFFGVLLFLIRGRLKKWFGYEGE
ncbi:hypothetical protein [uncultured Halopseudomonas sp.]|uniref:hypothetical protein n=1 Tax=uncultured Halopseudomonas sp. TaxID=2901193 RepID=UPI0030EB5278